MSSNLQNCLRREVNQPMSDLHSLKVSCQNEPSFYVSLSSREEQDIHFPQAGNFIKQLFFSPGNGRRGDFSRPQGWFWCCPTPRACPGVSEFPARDDSGALCAPLWIFLLHLQPCCASGHVLPPLALMVVPNPPLPVSASHCQCLPPIPACQGWVLCQCQGGEHKAPTHSEPPLHPCLLWGAEGQQIIIPCCSSLMHVFISYN